MQQTNVKQNLTTTDTAHFSSDSLVSEEETMGQIVVEILAAGKNLNRKALCDKLLKRIETSHSGDQKMHFLSCLQLVLERDA